MNRQQLLDLAERVEREEPSRDLDAEIAVGLGHRIQWVMANYTMDQYPAIAWQKPHQYAGMREPCPHWSTSLDAAVTLVPESWTAWELRSAQRKTRFYADLLRLTECDSGVDWASGYGNTPAAALTAAALRARAMEARDGTQIEYRVCLDPDCPQSVRAGDSHD